MTTMLITGWAPYPSVLIGFGLWTIAYVMATGHLRIRNNWGKRPASVQQISFHIGTLVGLIALTSPLDQLGDEYLFSAHMSQHLLLMFVAAPLWLVGTPDWLIDLAIPASLKQSVKWIMRPMPAFVIFTVVMWIWHLPALYDLAQNNEGLHIFEHLAFMGAALIGWWPVAAHSKATPQPAASVRMLYLFMLAVPMTALSAILTFSTNPFYAFYVNAPRLFGLSALDDQRLGALLMWVPAHMVLFLALGLTFRKWFVEEDAQQILIYSNSHE